MKKMKIIIVIFSLILLLILGIYIIFLFLKKDIMDGGNMTYEKTQLEELKNIPKNYDKLISIVYSNSGDMNGNIHKITLDIEKQIIITEDKTIHSDPLEVKEYKIEKEEIEKIKRDINTYNFPMWKDLEKDNDMIALDAASEGITFEYNNEGIGGNSKEWYHIDFSTKMTKETRKVLVNFKNNFKKLINKDNFIKEYLKEE